MSSPFLPRPDPMPLREALRGLRHLLRRGGETLAETLPLDELPRPAAAIAMAFMREGREMAQSVDDLASGLAKSVLGRPEASVVLLDDLDDASLFASAVYAALKSVLHRLGASGVLISEAAARRAFERGPRRDAARLTLDLLEARVLRGASAQDAARVPGAALEPVAIFAVMLWLQSARSEDDNEAALDSASDLSVALAAEIAQACDARDATALAALCARYAAHV